MPRDQMMPRTMRLPRCLLALCLALLAGSIGMLPASHIAAATTYTVNVTTDTGAGVGITGDLRYAITQVNAGSGGDTINITATGTIMLGSALPALTKDVTITGPGAAALAMDGGCNPDTSGCLGGGVTVLTINSGVTASISNLTIQHGNTSVAGGGGITNSGTLTLMNSKLFGNGNYEVGGSAIYNTGSLSIANTIFEKNRCYDGINPLALTKGGAIYSTGSLVVSNSTFVNNSVDTGYAHEVALGGAIQTSGTATITTSTFTANRVLGGYEGFAGGGAIANSGTSALTNLTISGNSTNGASTYGAGVYNTGTLTVTNSTIVGNTAFVGGGIGNSYECTNTCAPPGTTNLTNTIVAQNTGGDLAASAPGGFIGYSNLIDDAASAGGFTDGVNGNIVGHPALLGTLGNNGGPTQTISLLVGSPAIDAGAPVGQGPYGNTVPATDQRGIPRPQGSSVDIGAFELATPSPLPAPRPSGSPSTPAPLPSPRSAGQSSPSGLAPLPIPRTGSSGSGTASQPGGGAPTANPRPPGR